ncbi:Chromatin assembly factor 1 subunit rlf2 [Labeo rohita]|uniref:Chromatin assembly factor 1 subunit rlf2 n=1 Tax=Labeo rohita TaxID=84645 RepID=A0ABQ8L380_LABRO|nr:Chromatin assembly factor 1 subunit rlf2 [Labeo rohita]
MERNGGEGRQNGTRETGERRDKKEKPEKERKRQETSEREERKTGRQKKGRKDSFASLRGSHAHGEQPHKCLGLRQLQADCPERDLPLLPAGCGVQGGRRHGLPHPLPQQCPH